MNAHTYESNPLPGLRALARHHWRAGRRWLAVRWYVTLIPPTVRHALSRVFSRPPVTVHVVVTLDGKDVARTVLAELQHDALRQYGDSTRWRDVQ